jgi:hypothetical protein
MARAVNQVRWGQWRQRMERQQASGLSVAEFCRRENLSPHGFYVWRRKLGSTPSTRRVSDRAVPTSRKRRPTVMTRRRPRPTPATPPMPTRSPGFFQLPVTAVRPTPWIELALADGTVVRLPQQNLAALVTVLRVLRGEPLDLSCGESDHA